MILLELKVLNSKKNSLKNYIEFRHGSACYSYVGRKRLRKGQGQEIGLAPRCAEKHTLIHEVSPISTLL